MVSVSCQIRSIGESIHNVNGRELKAVKKKYVLFADPKKPHRYYSIQAEYDVVYTMVFFKSYKIEKYIVHVIQTDENDIVINHYEEDITDKAQHMFGEIASVPFADHTRSITKRIFISLGWM